MSKEINLSYVTATFNKLPYLKLGLEKLIEQKKDDEEILVDDGGSYDGTKEYLTKLKNEGKIDFFISEPNYGESHSLNKLFPIANGKLVKIINDDDAYNYPAINKCKDFMLSHPDIDILGAEGGSYKHSSAEKMSIRQITGYTENYKKWQQDGTPFEFTVLGYMFRKSALPMIGYWNTTFIMADVEATFKATASKANLAWYTGSTYVYIRNQNSITWTKRNRIESEVARLRKFYLNENPTSHIRKALKSAMTTIRGGWKKDTATSPIVTPWKELHGDAMKWLDEKNRTENPEFFWKK